MFFIGLRLAQSIVLLAPNLFPEPRSPSSPDFHPPTASFVPDCPAGEIPYLFGLDLGLGQTLRSRPFANEEEPTAKIEI
jgi:hypothetical protein